ncbi:PEP-CTERM sorting domain-containing protein [Trichothermofontia sp.]
MASAVPEPTTILGMLTATGLGAIIKRRQLKRV